MSQITAAELWDFATLALSGQGFTENDAKEISEEFVIAELSGTKTHGIGKLVSLNLGQIGAEPTMVQRGAITSVNGNGSNGFLLFKRLTEVLAVSCRQHGIAAVTAYNFSRYSSLYPYTTRVASAGLISILMNSAGPAAVAPYGSVDPITGTNPLCFSFPRPGGTAQTFDFATSEMVWGAIRQASLENMPLPFGPFLDHSGEPTTKPSDVNAVKAFGGKKGWALNLAIEILAGILPGGRAGVECQSEFDCGALFIAIDPEAVGLAPESFGSQLEALLTSIRSSRSANASSGIRVPGDSGRNARSVTALQHEIIEVPDSVLQMLDRMAKGEKVQDLASNSLFN